MMDGWDMGGGIGAWLTIWAVGAVVVALVVALGRRVDSRDAAGPVDDPALALLHRRFAAGEITEDEFERRRAHLEPLRRAG